MNDVIRIESLVIIDNVVAIITRTSAQLMLIAAQQTEPGMSSTRGSDGVILTAIGNPVVDVEVMIPDPQFFVRHNIPVDGQRPEPIEFINTLKKEYEERNYQMMILPGGCAQNTLRVFQWLMNSKFQSCMIGSVGNDDGGVFLTGRLQEDGVKPCFVVVDNWPTYTVYIFVHEKSRYIAYPAGDRGAAGAYSLSRFLGHAEALQAIENSLVVFIEGFYAEHSPQVAQKMLDMCIDTGVVTSFNICGNNVVEEYFEESVLPFLKKCSVVVGNASEFESLCKKLKVHSASATQAAVDVHKLMMSFIPSTVHRIKSLEKYKKILVVTNGDKEIHCVTASDGLVKHVPPSLDRSAIKDTTGAGDSFIAGLLYGLVKEQPISKCLDIGCRAAAQIIQQYGVTVPKEKANFLQ